MLGYHRCVRSIFGGTSEIMKAIMKAIIAREVTGLRAYVLCEFHVPDS